MIKHVSRIALLAPLFAASSAFAVSDADGIIGTLDFTGLAANVSSVVEQAFPVAALAAGVILGLAFLGWVVSMIGRALGRARRTA